MDDSNVTLTAWSYGLAGAAYMAFALHLLRIGYWRMPGKAAARLLLAAVFASALWGWFGLADQFARTVFFMRLGALADLAAGPGWAAVADGGCGAGLLVAAGAGGTEGRWL
jgi:peptidoglycan/LPS O-acetylase OafA/YrhL